MKKVLGVIVGFFIFMFMASIADAIGVIKDQMQANGEDAGVYIYFRIEP